MSGFPQGEAELVAFFIESVMWGIQLVTFILCLWMITGTVNSRTAKQRTIFTFTSWPLVYASGLFTIGTVHLCLSLYDILQAFVFYKGVGGADNQYNEISGTSRAYVRHSRSKSRCSRKFMTDLTVCTCRMHGTFQPLWWRMLLWYCLHLYHYALFDHTHCFA